MLQHPAIQKLLEPATSEKVLGLPAHIFFIESVEIPVELEPGELDDFAELTIESISPFPLDQLYWGFVASESSNRILLYAAHRERVKKASSEPIEAYAWVVPEFAPLASTPFSENTEIILTSETSVSLLQFAQGEAVPIYVNAAACTPEEITETIGELRSHAPKSKPNTTQIHLNPSSATLRDDQSPVFHFQREEDNAQPEDDYLSQINLTGPQLWQADLRDPNYKKAERNARRISFLSVRTLGWAALFMLFLIGVEFLLFGSHLWLGSQEKRIARQQPIVDTISEQQTLMFKLEQIERNDLRPIAILHALNTMRPEGIYFTKTVVEGENQVVIDGVSNNVSALNRYTDALQQSGNFELLQSPKSLTRQGKTTFTLQLAFNSTKAETPPVAPEGGQPNKSDA
ncbi:MAG: PilN domain-containing protein [Coraliomargaritaceae bacterium]